MVTGRDKITGQQGDRLQAQWPVHNRSQIHPLKPVQHEHPADPLQQVRVPQAKEVVEAVSPLQQARVLQAREVAEAVHPLQPEAVVSQKEKADRLTEAEDRQQRFK